MDNQRSVSSPRLTDLVTAVGPADQPKARRIPEACRALGISRATIYKLASQNKIRLVHIGGRTVVPETEINRLVSSEAT
jgi:excisionase family DNA binding protein